MSATGSYMIWYYVLLFITSLLTAVFSWLPVVTTLPQFGGVDIDTYLVSAVGYFHSFIDTFWYMGDFYYYGFTPLIFYFSTKLVLKLFLGARAPGTHHA